jgi:hypothetical protein
MKTFRVFRIASHHTPHELHSLHVDLSVIIIQHEKNPPMILLHGETKPKNFDW